MYIQSEERSPLSLTFKFLISKARENKNLPAERLEDETPKDSEYRMMPRFGGSGTPSEVAVLKSETALKKPASQFNSIKRNKAATDRSAYEKQQKSKYNNMVINLRKATVLNNNKDASQDFAAEANFESPLLLVSRICVMPQEEEQEE